MSGLAEERSTGQRLPEKLRPGDMAGSRRAQRAGELAKKEVQKGPSWPRGSESSEMPSGWGEVAQPCSGLSGYLAIVASSGSVDLSDHIFKMGVMLVLPSCGFMQSFKIRLRAQRTVKAHSRFLVPWVNL